MDPEVLRALIRETGVDLWSLLDTAIAVAAADHGTELKARRDRIVERLYSPAEERCRNCEKRTIAGRSAESEEKRSSSPGGRHRCSESISTPPSPLREEEAEQEEKEDEEEEKRDYAAIDDEQSKILAIKDFLEDPDQLEDSLISLLQNLADMDITFKALKETDIGRHVNSLRKHPSLEVRRLVKLLVRKWKETVDEWVKSNSANESSSPAIITDGDSPLQLPAKNSQNGHRAPDFACSPNLNSQNRSWQPEINGPESAEPKPSSAACREAQSKPISSISSSSAPAKLKDNLLDPERLASARKRLHDNYQEAQNARKQRTIQVMDLHEIPRPKNSFMARNKNGFHGNKHW